MSTDKQALEIFYADDQKTDRMLFEVALNEISTPTRLKTAIDGQEAMIFLNDGDGYVPDIIFLDIKMPLMDGIECLQEIRKNEKFKLTPVIIFSTSDDPKDIQQAYKNNANLYVTKPFDINHQVEVMKKIFTLNWNEYFPNPSQEKFVFKS